MDDNAPITGSTQALPQAELDALTDKLIEEDLRRARQAEPADAENAEGKSET